MKHLLELWAEAMHLRAQGDMVQAQELFQQFDERAVMLGLSPQHSIVRHILFEADTSSIEKIWKSAVEFIEESLDMYQDDDQVMSRLETLMSLTQVYIYLHQPEEASSSLDQARQLLARIDQEDYLETTPFSGWEPVIINAKRQQIENLSKQISFLPSID